MQFSLGKTAQKDKKKKNRMDTTIEERKQMYDLGGTNEDDLKRQREEFTVELRKKHKYLNIDFVLNLYRKE